MCERWRQKGGLALCPCTQAGGSWSSGRRTTRRESGALASRERAVQDAEGPLGSSPPPPAPPPLPSPRPASSGSATPPRAAAPGRGREGGASGGRGSSTLTAPGGGAELPARPGRAPRREQTRDRELRREGPGGRERGRTRCRVHRRLAAHRARAWGRGRAVSPLGPGLPPRTLRVRPAPFPLHRILRDGPELPPGFASPSPSPVFAPQVPPESGLESVLGRSGVVGGTAGRSQRVSLAQGGGRRLEDRVPFFGILVSPMLGRAAGPAPCLRNE